MFEDALANPNDVKIAIALCDMVTKDPPPTSVVEDFLTTSQYDTKTIVVEDIYYFGSEVIEENTVDKAGTRIHMIIQQIVARYFLYDLFV